MEHMSHRPENKRTEKKKVSATRASRRLANLSNCSSLSDFAASSLILAASSFCFSQKSASSSLMRSDARFRNGVSGDGADRGGVKMPPDLGFSARCIALRTANAAEVSDAVVDAVAPAMVPSEGHAAKAIRSAEATAVFPVRFRNFVVMGKLARR
uniref:Uncharacterized protein n=1 Tax=Pseudictyota dubia TaxID=2749911 RepID=A0A7R9W4W1_9STRA